MSNSTALRPSLSRVFAQHGLGPFRRILSSSVLQQVMGVSKRAGTQLTPGVVFWLLCLVSLQDGSMASICASSFLVGATPVTDAAFCLARRSLGLLFLQRTFAYVVLLFYRRFRSNWTWKGFRVLAVDGTYINTPSAPLLKTVFGVPRTGGGVLKRPQALLVGLVDVYTGICLSYVLQRFDGAELKALPELLSEVCSRDILLGDRCYASYAAMAQVRRASAHFLFRLPVGRFFAREHQWFRMGNDRKFPEWKVLIARPKTISTSETFPPMMVARVILHRPPRGQAVILITSLLDRELYPAAEVVGLYPKRWVYESTIREWKYDLQFANLRSHSPNGIHQEILAQLILRNALYILMAEASSLGKNVPPVEMSFRSCKRLLFDAITILTIAASRQWKELNRWLLEAMSKALVVIRPGRSYPRKKFKGRQSKRVGKRPPKAWVFPDSNIAVQARFA